MKESKIVLVTNKIYSEAYQEILESLLQKGCELFCVLGQDSENWEEAMDWLAASKDNASIITTSHISEDLEEVLNMAQYISVNTESRIKIVRV